MGRLINTADLYNEIMKAKDEFGVLSVDIVNWLEAIVRCVPTAEQIENPTKDIYSAIEYWKSVDEDNNMVKWLTELQEYRKSEREKADQTYDWCDGCKEYDNEKHCCHRYSSFIRESLQDNINVVLEDIKVEIDKQTEIYADGEFYIKNIDVKRILDRYINEKE